MITKMGFYLLALGNKISVYQLIFSDRKKLITIFANEYLRWIFSHSNKIVTEHFSLSLKPQKWLLPVSKFMWHYCSHRTNVIDWRPKLLKDGHRFEFQEKSSFNKSFTKSFEIKFYFHHWFTRRVEKINSKVFNPRW